MTKIKPIGQDGDVESFLAKVRSLPPVTATGKRGRLVLAMDATMSRQPTWDRALSIQADMFAETGRIGGLDVQLVYFRGFNECRASRWTSDAQGLGRLMTGVECRGGNTQILRVLKHLKAEADKTAVNAMVYVGDAFEETIDTVAQAAGEVGLLGVPVFMFQEGRDPNAERAFREIARLTRGAYFRFGSDSARTLRDLLAAVAVYAAGGHAALADHSARQGGSARLLLEQMK
ncbi:MAG: VWA domain-containing protein [Alphaproteobacteria bacterium]|nr:VWA domain-containing protein [Alphaproteobacteria bacterium]